MARYLRQSSVSTVKLGPFVSPSDGITPYTSGGFTVKVGANGGALASRHDSTAIAHDADGYYAVELDATDTAAVGRLKLEVPGSSGNYLPAWDDCVVLSQAVYDVLFGSTAPSTYAGADTSGTTTLLSRLSSTRATNLDNLDAAISTRSTYAGGDTSGTTTLLSRLSSTRAGLLDNLDATVSSRLATSGYTSPPDAATITSTVWQSLTNTANFTTNNSIGKLLVTDIDASISSRLATSGYAAAPTAATNATTLLDLATSGHTTAGTVGAAIAAAAGAGDPWATALPGSYAAGTAGYVVGHNIDATMSSRLATSGYTVPPTATSISTTLLDTATSGHTTAGSVGAAITSGSAPTVSQIATGVWQSLLSSSNFTINASIGQLLASNIDVPIGSRSDYAGGPVESVTGDVGGTVQGDVGGNVRGSVAGSVTTVIGDVKIRLTDTLGAARDQSTLPDSSVTVQDALWAAVIEMAGREAVVGTGWTKKTAAGSAVRQFILDDATNPTSRT